MNDFLKAEPVPAYLAASFRTFSPGEFHVTRNAPYSVLLLLMKGTLRFEEDGISVEVKAGEYYIQRAGLTQHARQPSDMPHYFYIHFVGGELKLFPLGEKLKLQKIIKLNFVLQLF